MDRQQAILDLFQPGVSLPFREISKKLTPSVPDRTLHYDLARLRDMKLLVSKGKGRAVIWQRTIPH